MGQPAYGRSFTVKGQNYGLGGTASGAGTQGQHTKSEGFLAYYEICDKINNEQWTTKFDDTIKSVYAFSKAKEQWVGYENTDSLAHRCDFINQRALGGVMFWDTSLDDMKGLFCGNGEYPLISLFNTCMTPAATTTAGTTGQTSSITKAHGEHAKMPKQKCHYFEHYFCEMWSHN